MSFTLESDELVVAMSYQHIAKNRTIDKAWNSIFNISDINKDDVNSSNIESKDISLNNNSLSKIVNIYHSDDDDVAPTLKLVLDDEESISSDTITREKPPYKGKIDTNKIHKLQTLLDCIRIKPEAYNDIRETTYLNHNQIELCNASNTNDFPESSYRSYGNSSKSHIKKIKHSGKDNNNTGKTYGQDYIYTDRNRIFELDGHGYDGEVYAAFAGIRFSHYTDHSHIDKLIIEEDYCKIIEYMQSIFSKIANDIMNCTKNTFDINMMREYKCVADILKNRSIDKGGGTTANYCSLHTVTTISGIKKRFIVAANIGDSETYAIMRFPDGSRKIKVLSGNHSVENIEEATRIINANKHDIKSVMPIYSRFNVYNRLGNLVNPFPKEAIPHLDHLDTSKPFPIYDIIEDCSLQVNGETLHKVQMGLGKYGRIYNINEWFGGIQGLRSHVIEKNIEGVWQSVAPVPLGSPVNFGSTPNGETQSTRVFGDLNFSAYIDIQPHVCILQVPDDAHLTIISSSDGYSDTVYLSQVADQIGKIPYGTINSAKDIKINLTNLMFDNIVDKHLNGYTMNNMLQPMWDDVSFGIIDSPPYIPV